ncbi:unnamed protein product, partial [Prorocentrum cordatum]
GARPATALRRPRARRGLVCAPPEAAAERRAPRAGRMARLLSRGLSLPPGRAADPSRPRGNGGSEATPRPPGQRRRTEVPRSQAEGPRAPWDPVIMRLPEGRACPPTGGFGRRAKHNSPRPWSENNGLVRGSSASPLSRARPNSAATAAVAATSPISDVRALSSTACVPHRAPCARRPPSRGGTGAAASAALG